MWPTWPIVGFKRRFAGQHAAAALAPGEPREAEARLVVGEESLDADSAALMPLGSCSCAIALPQSAEHVVQCRRRRRRRRDASRNCFSENICASSDRSCRCCSVACSGTSSTKTLRDRLGRPARRTASAIFRRTNAPRASREALDPPVRYRDSLTQAGRAELLAREQAVDDDPARRGRCRSRTARPIAANSVAFDPASRSARTLSAGSSSAIWFIGAKDGSCAPVGNRVADAPNANRRTPPARRDTSGGRLYRRSPSRAPAARQRARGAFGRRRRRA